MPNTDAGAVAGPARPEDAAALAELAALTFPLACPPAVSSAEAAGYSSKALSADAFTGFLADPARLVLTARRDGKLMGYALLVFDPPSEARVAEALQGMPGPAAELSRFYTHPDAHGRGVASALMAAAVRAAASSGQGTLWLGVNDLNLRAQAFYRKSGFTVVGRRLFSLGQHVFDDFVFARPLGQAG